MRKNEIEAEVSSFHQLQEILLHLNFITVPLKKVNPISFFAQSQLERVYLQIISFFL
jgi:hypothetical protein